MRHFGDHATRLRRIDEFRDAPDLIELKTDECLTLAVMAALRTAGLPDLYGFASILIGIHD
jgi:hypothetical protein